MAFPTYQDIRHAIIDGLINDFILQNQYTHEIKIILICACDKPTEKEDLQRNSDFPNKSMRYIPKLHFEVD